MKSTLRLFCFSLLMCAVQLNASEQEVSGLSPKEEEKEQPWLIGTLLSLVPTVIPAGYVDIEPFFPVSDAFGYYDAHWHSHSQPSVITTAPLFFFQAGLTDRINFIITPQAINNRTKGRSSTHFGDLLAGFAFQLLQSKEQEWPPSILLLVSEIFPTGKYEKLSPNKLNTDVSGEGVFATQLSLVFTHLFDFGNHRFLSLYLTLQDTLPSSTHVRDYNSYGGGKGTRGRVRSGNIFTTILSMEYAFTRHWVLAFDIQNSYASRSTFSGKRGFNRDGSKASVGEPSADQIILAPAIEYNFSLQYGLILGPVFTVAGYNAPRFAGATLALNFYFSVVKGR